MDVMRILPIVAQVLTNDRVLGIIERLVEGMFACKICGNKAANNDLGLCLGCADKMTTLANQQQQPQPMRPPTVI